MYSIQTQINGVRKKATQDWSIGKIVKVGFLTLRVLHPNQKGLDTFGAQTLPNGYILESLDGKKQYSFVPHLGLSKI